MNLKSEDMSGDKFLLYFKTFGNSMRQNKPKKYNNKHATSIRREVGPANRYHSQYTQCRNRWKNNNTNTNNSYKKRTSEGAVVTVQNQQVEAYSVRLVTSNRRGEMKNSPSPCISEETPYMENSALTGWNVILMYFKSNVIKAGDHKTLECGEINDVLILLRWVQKAHHISNKKRMGSRKL